MEKRKTAKSKLIPYLMILPSLLIILVVIFIPIIISIGRSFQLEEGGYGISNYTYFFLDEQQQRNMLYTLKIVVITVLSDIVISYLLAMYLRFSISRLSKRISSLYMLPRFVPGLVAVNGMITIIRDSGLINRISQLFGANLKLGLM